MEVVRDILKIINDSKQIAVIYHVNADGDAVGSALAIMLAFGKDKEIDIFGEEHVNHNLRFLPGSSGIIISDYNSKVYDLAIAVDCGDYKRMGERQNIFNLANTKINIDHHKSNDIVGDINYIDINASSCGELVYKIIKEANIDIIKETAECLYTAIVTDTGSFKHSNTSAFTHEVAAELIRAGINIDHIYRSIYEDVPFSRLKLLGRILNNMRLYNNGKISISHTDYKEVEELGASFEDLENIANYGLQVQNVEVSIFLREHEENKIKISFRSKTNFDCSQFARLFEGGGHARAAGCELHMSKEEAEKLLLGKIVEYF